MSTNAAQATAFHHALLRDGSVWPGYDVDAAGRRTACGTLRLGTDAR